MKIKENFAKWLKLSLGLFLVVYALNQFFHFFDMGYGDMPEQARYFIDAVIYYLPFLYIFEIMIGLLLIFNKWPTFILIVLFPLSVSFLMFTFINNDLGEMWPAVVVALLNVALLINDKEKYKILFT